ncbi:5-oxoprolinase [Niveispirillum lacus]|uniref:5-oxoprolinase n=1 Tax=Niveispirillum lacus TaxID=1981099 RepID=A0A255YR17_9PROT|nr:hydantoinase/oxoprolinase family protein [Niveispirillum lacus]OYQ31658.1 5-oxoprolinase [Niveispirillum lacus]
MAYRLGVDVGGTFTDLLLIEDETGETFRDKVPSTPHDPSVAVVTGTLKICAKAGIDPKDVQLFMHGTTVATNTVLTSTGARVGLVTTDGYRQVLHIARSFVPGGLAGWIVWNKPPLTAPLECTVEVPERIGADGSIVTPLDEAALRVALEKLKGEGIEALTIAFINAYRNDAHEVRAGQIAREVFPDLPVSLSSEVLPEMQEYERALTTVANSYVRPRVANYVRNLKAELNKAGMNGQMNLLRSDAGLMSFEKAQDHPVNLLMSGPAGGVAGALWVCGKSGFKNLLTVDVGGTSTDVALIENGQPRLARETECGDLKVRATSLDIRTVGAGGGSIAFVPDLTKALRVGPASAGAVPGPVCYSRGGDKPTVTDANVVLGYLPEELLGGTMRLDRPAASASVQNIADTLGIDLAAAANGIYSIANETMMGALRLISVQQGYDPRDFALVAFGGAGPLHANALGKLLGSWPVIVPPSPGVLCAFGDATTRLRAERAKSVGKIFAEVSNANVAALLADLRAAVARELLAEGVAEADQEITFEAGVRYSGQAFEVSLPVALDGFAEGGLEALAASFDKEHERLFTFCLDSDRELVTVRATALGKASAIRLERLPRGDGNPAAAKVRDHVLWADGKEHPAVIYDRAKLKAGDFITGPAIICEMDSTTVLLPDHGAEVDDYGLILIRPLATA